MKQEPQSPSSASPLRSEVHAREITEYVVAHGITRDEYFRAHELALGVSEHETEQKGEVSQTVHELAQLLKHKFDERMPVTVSADIADDLGNFAEAPERLRTLIASLNISENEKRVLNSVFDRQRDGTLEVYVQGEKSPEFGITVEPSLWRRDLSLQRFAFELFTALNALKDKRLEITWSE